MNIRDIQRLLAEVGLYRGAIDGDAGPKTLTAARDWLANYPTVPWRTWSTSRLLVAAGQAVLDRLGYEPGLIDGYSGHNTREALTTWESGARAAVERIATVAASGAQNNWPRQDRVRDVFGNPGGPQCTSGIVQLPLPFVIAWDTRQTVRSFRCHEMVAAPLTRIFSQAVAHYGTKQFEELRLNVFGGCFNHRTMRGGSALSMHSWGIAVDLDPERNQLRWGRDRASLAASVYNPFWSIVESVGAVSLGRVANRDWMHFQFARL